jgi:hypothetical protein
MKRIIASALLLLLTSAILAPTALAFVPAPANQHACCLRKQPHCHHETGGVSVRTRECCLQHECCRALKVQQTAHLAPTSTLYASHLAAPVALPAAPAHKNFSLRSCRSVRAPPAPAAA